MDTTMIKINENINKYDMNNSNNDNESENNKLMQQTQQILMNELKKKIYNIKNELM